MTSPPRAPDVPGYAILGLLGSGGLGAVWRARNASGEIVALKVVEPRRLVDSATADRIFRREALAGLNLDHPGIVRALDAVKARDGRPCIVFELAEGPTLRDAVKERGPLPACEVLAVARAAAAALDHAHRHGVVHGDLAPGNVLLAEGGARLLDFGLVAELEAEPGGSVWATPGFTAPEVVAGGAPTAVSDLFALGRTLAFALLGRAPEGDGDLGLPGERTGLVAVIERLGKRDPAGRYRSAAELGLDLDAVRAGEAPLGAALAGAKARMAARRTGPWVLAAAACAVLAGWLLLRDGGTAPAPLPPPPAPAPAAVPDPLAGKVEALRVLLGRDPVDFGAARSLAAEIRKAGREDAVLAELDARWREAAAAIAVRKNAEAQAALTAGDRAAWRKVMLEWPAGFGDAAEAAAMQAQWERWDAAVRKMAVQAEASLAAAEKALAGGSVADPAALDADLARMQEDPATPPDLRRRAGELRAKAGAKAAEAAKFAKETAIRDAIRAFLESAARPDPAARVQELLTEAIGKAEGTEKHAALEDLRNGAHRAETALARALERIEGKPWAAVIDEKLFVGIVQRAPLTEAVLLPLAGRCQDLLAIVPDRADVSSWLAVRGMTSVARGLGPAGSPVARSLPFMPGYPEYPERKDPVARLLWLSQPIDASPAKPKENPAKGRAVEAYLADDLLGAWSAIEESFRADYPDAEVHVLAARVLIGLSRPLSTRRIRTIALAEALKAADLDPTLYSAHSAVIEIAMPLEQEEFRSFGDNTGLAYLTLVLRAMEASIPLGRESPEGFVALAKKLHESGQVLGAKKALEFARRLKATLPPWAEDLLR